MLFSYFLVSYDIVKLQTCSSLHIWAIAIFRFSVLSKSGVTWKQLHLQYFLWIYFPPTFYTLTVNLVLYFWIPFTGHKFCVLFFLCYSETQNIQSADTEPVHGHWLFVSHYSPCLVIWWRYNSRFRKFTNKLMMWENNFISKSVLSFYWPKYLAVISFLKSLFCIFHSKGPSVKDFVVRYNESAHSILYSWKPVGGISAYTLYWCQVSISRWAYFLNKYFFLLILPLSNRMWFGSFYLRGYVI